MPMMFEKADYNWTNDTRMDVVNKLTVGQFMALPDDTEVIFVSIAPFAVGVSVENVTLSDAVRTELREKANENGKTDDDLMPYSLIVTLLPEDWVPDIATITEGKFRTLGERHGREGAPMLSESMLKSRNADDWTDGAYRTYLTAYKAAAEKRKGR